MRALLLCFLFVLSVFSDDELQEKAVAETVNVDLSQFIFSDFRRESDVDIRNIFQEFPDPVLQRQERMRQIPPRSTWESSRPFPSDGTVCPGTISRFSDSQPGIAGGVFRGIFGGILLLMERQSQ